MISRREICSKLKIDSRTLEEYLNFIAYPQPYAHSFENNLAQAIYKLHELIELGFSFNDIKDLIHCSEKFCHLIPALKDFLQLSESINLRETIESYNEVFEEFSSREEQYQSRIKELESDINILKSQLDKAAILENRLENYQNEIDNLKSKNSNQRLHITKLEMQNHELEEKNENLLTRIKFQEEEIEAIKNDNHVKMKNRSAIDINALLKKKEKEVSRKYQKEIIDLKKQVDFILENQEEKRLKRNLEMRGSSR